MEETRPDSSCGLIRNPDNGVEVVLAGYGTSEIFNLASGTWREGPDTPYFNFATSAQLKDTFLVVGGRDEGNQSLDTIYQFDHLEYRWILKSQRLNTPRYGPGVVALPADYLQC